jgi:Ca2+-binding RTX toxin-like protein
MTVFTQFPGQASDEIENISGTVAMPSDGSDLPQDDLARDLATGESVLGDAPQGAYLQDALAGPALDLIDIAVRAAMPLQFSFGQADTPLASFGVHATGMSAQPDITVSVIEISNYSNDCGCPICGGGSDSAAPATWDASPPSNPPTHGTITQLADYLRVTYWDDRGDRDPRQFNMGATGNNGILRYDLTGWTGTLATDTGGSFADTNGIASTATRNLIRDAFDWYGQVLGITFIETESGSSPATGTVDFFFTDADSTSFFNSTETFGGNGGNINYNVINIASSTANNNLYSTILHEIGHGLGLGHQGNYNNSASFATQAIYRNDSYQLSNMSYFSVAGNPFVEGSSVRGVTMQTADLHALNAIYGAQGFGPYANAFTGDTTYGVGTNITAAQSRILNELTTHAATNLFTIVDAGGIDKVDFSNFSANQNINLTVITSGSTTGSVSSVGGLTNNMFIAVGTIIENAEGGSGNDTLTGNQYANYLIGNAGNDILYGGAGIDSLEGFDGNDTIYGGTSGDTIKGGGGDDLIYGESGNDYSKGGAGNDTIYAGSGIDTIQGDAGDDRVIVTTAATLAGAGFYGGTQTDTLVVDGAGTYDLRNSTLTGFEELEFDADGVNVVKNIHITGAQAVGLGLNARIDGSNYDGAHDRLYIYLATSGTTTLNMSGWIMQDWVQTAAQNDFLSVGGGAAAETVTGTSRDDYMDMGGGADLAYGGSGNDTLKGGAGNDSLYGGLGNDNLQGGDDNDNLYAGGGNDTLYGDAGSDYFYGAAGASTSLFYGDDGNDTFYKASGTTAGISESWYGGNGTGDWLIWTNAGVTSTRVVNLATGFITQSGANRDIVQGIEHVSVENGAGVVGDGGANWLQAVGNFANSLDGGAGNDTLKGGAGNDTLRGGAGVDYLLGEDGDDTLYDGDNVSGADSMYGGIGNDTLVKESSTGPGGLKIWDGGDGTDTFDFAYNGSAGWTVNLDAGRIFSGASLRDFLSNIENVIVRNNQAIIGDAGANVLTAVGVFDNSISGGAGNDTIDGGDGNDTLYGGLGDDNMIGGTGNDGMEGGDGADSMTGGAGSDVMLGQVGNDTMYGGDDNDFVYGGDDNDSLYGDNGDDLLSGELGNDFLNGGAGNDVAYGGEGDDTLDGWSGDDSLFGDSGNDGVWGFIGNDTLNGGAGTDTLYGEDGDDSMVSGLGDGFDNFYGGLGTDTVDLSALTPEPRCRSVRRQLFGRGAVARDCLHRGAADGQRP